MTTRWGFRRGALLLALPLAAFLWAGCGKDASTGGNEPAPAEGAIDLSQAWGGLTDTDEPANFGDPEFAALAVPPAPVNDPMNNHPAVRRLEADPTRHVTFLRVTWGNLARNLPDSTGAFPPLDWSGNLAVSRGALLINNLIRFEREDSLVRPRTDPKVVAWHSLTRGGVDGLLLRVITGDSVGAGDTITLTTPQVTVSFPLATLATLDTLLSTDNSGNGVSLTAVPDDRRDECAGGLLDGVWREGLADGGVLRAAWLTRNGLLFGVLRGRYGIRPDGSHIFLAKVIGPAGRCLGFVRGTWSEPTAGAPQGGFRGRWFAPDRTTELGGLRGHWRAPRSGATGAGFLHGAWSRACGENPGS